MKNLLLILATFLLSDIFAQKTDTIELKGFHPPSFPRSVLSIANVYNPKGYYLFPDSVLSDSVDAILYKNVNPKSMDTSFYSMYWISPCNDGYYHLNISPEQIYLTSTHDNPNPNYISWCIKIKPEQYNSIKSSLSSDSLKGFKSYMPHDFYDMNFTSTVNIPEDWNDSTQQILRMDCEEEMKSQISRYFRIINSMLSPNNQLAVPSSVELRTMKPKYISTFEPELRDWLPIQIPKEEY